MHGMESINDSAGQSADKLHLIWVLNVWVTKLFLYFNLFCYIGLLFFFYASGSKPRRQTAERARSAGLNSGSTLHLHARVAHPHRLGVLFWLLEIQFSIISV